MNRIHRFALVALAAGTLAAAAPARATDVSIYDPRGRQVPPIGKIPSVSPTRVALPNGAVVYLLENHDLPVVRGIAYFPSSPTLVPADRQGLAGITGTAMRSGGSMTHGGDWLDDRLGAIGASLTSNVGGTLASAGFRCLSENTDEVVGLWAELIRQPAFPTDKVELARVGVRRQIASRNDEMLPMLYRVAAQAVYGKDSPWARQPEYATIEPITRDDCRTLHAKVFVPERMIVAIYGDFRAADVQKRLTAVFGTWAKSGTPKPVLPPTPTSVTPRVVFAPKEDVTQSAVLLAEVGHRADDPDYAAMQVVDQGLGGGQSSRLYVKIRSERGLAYYAGSRAGAEYERPGVFTAASLTRNDSTLTALGLVRDELRRLIAAPFSQQELETAKQAVVNGYVFNFEDPSQTLFRAAYYEAIGYPADFLQRYQKSLDAVTAQGALEAARRKVHPDAEVVIVVGKEKEFERPLESLGLPVERVDVSIPPPPGKASAAARPEAKQKGRQWLAAATEKAGGAGAWGRVKGALEKSEATVSMGGQSVSLTGEDTWRFPDHRVALQRTPYGEMRSGFDGSIGWASMMGQVQEDAHAGSALTREWERSLWRIFGHAGDLELVAQDADETIDGVAYHAAAVSGASTQDLTLLFAADGTLAGVAYQDDGGGGRMPPARVVTRYSDWRAVGGIQYPHASSATRGGEKFMDAKVTSLQLDPPMGDELFRKPAK